MLSKDEGSKQPGSRLNTADKQLKKSCTNALDRGTAGKLLNKKTTRGRTEANSRENSRQGKREKSQTMTPQEVFNVVK
jgi:hypothetical protein